MDNNRFLELLNDNIEEVKKSLNLHITNEGRIDVTLKYIINEINAIKEAKKSRRAELLAIVALLLSILQWGISLFVGH